MASKLMELRLDGVWRLRLPLVQISDKRLITNAGTEYRLSDVTSTSLRIASCFCGGRAQVTTDLSY